MTSTDSLPEDQTVADRSVGYTKMNGAKEWGPNVDTLPYRGTSAGGGYSTVEDLLAFANALESHKLLDAKVRLHRRLIDRRDAKDSWSGGWISHPSPTPCKGGSLR